TSNPDVLCNSEIKFQAFLEHALRLGADCIATGHYARLAHSGGTAQLLKAADPAKDQTYFLHAVSQRALGQAIFPLGDLHKGRVRELAREAGFANHAKKDSTGICFIGERRFREFLGRYLPAQPGDMCTPDGRRLGRHNGLMYYTLGQRQGLGIGGRREAGDAPWYVVDKDLDNNVLVVGQGADHPRLFSEALRTGTPHWIAGHPPVVPMHCEARLRHRQPVQACEVHTLPTGGLEVVFEQPQRAVTPGQYAVFYKGDLCLGGAVIEERVAGAPVAEAARRAARRA
ncbi:MAG: tRNA 2-thiouridine(34) synthase MnmA, partial [Gammaproteobacteria bacterium]